ncbi:hypothetical protein [Spirosoma endophyticum]|uniref:Uncharacterized protein n=1 Tax=Spirosoma endophyticum TaxID=662367 RepID=A0A1I2EL19_9BACT|nr:hypothetical protein [Spirosoma endophyticum]SFE93469.1 hypothetical protein SAMN05216167_12263 [Spirosoma endophyticum]
MNRRTFICAGAAVSLCALPYLQARAYAQSIAPITKPDWLVELIKLNDQQLTSIQGTRVTEPGAFFGALKDGDGTPNPQSTSDFVRRSGCAISCPESSFYQSEALLKEIDQALGYLLKAQHEDGTLDLPATNFHSAPDTGFIVKRLVPTYTLLERSKTSGQEAVLATFKTFLLRAGEALTVGGIHTPNHRWVISAALTKLNERWPNPRYVSRIEQWLSEHIDMDSDGQYNERSTLIYSPLTNRLLITIAKGLNKPILLDYVRRNLSMTRYYVHPNGEMVTEASGRQDKALVGMMDGYYFPYRYLALRDNDGEMAAMCRLIEKTAMPKVVYQLDYLLEDPTLWKELPASKPLPTNYVKTYPHSGLVRIRRDQWDSTILSANPVWFTFHKGDAVLQGMRVASSFFGKGQFQTEKIEQRGDSWVLTQSLDGPYYQPYPTDRIPVDGDWEKMPRINRAQSEVQKLQTNVTLRESQGGMQVQVQITGTDGVPVALELIFRPGGTFTGVSSHPSRANAYLLANSGTYTVKTDKISFGPGQVAHKNVQLRGSLPAMDAPSVYITGFTPFEHTIRLS